jgi:dipeptidyl aminopeptidase/acylaminoacyl peptidase
VSAFTALQTRGIPSRIVLFPDEGHWINKPQNALTWYTEFVGFFDTHLNAT